jgi:hypothetical protein
MDPFDSHSSENYRPDDYASLTSEAGEYVFENGRRYHGYKAGSESWPDLIDDAYTSRIHGAK